ncbi:MAG: EAL domain-containing response regulator [Azoarcus sp.]|nr:EAL domain-containing response regulator [Azoarcus sp.]
MTTLVIDDEAFVRKLLTHLLGRLGLTEVVACASGREALDYMGSAPATVDLVFCDLQMPGMDGVEFIRHLVDLRYTGALVLVSGEDQRILHTAGRLARAHRLDVLGEVTKPVTPTQLGEVLARRGTQRAPACVGGRRMYEVAELRRALDAGELVNHYQPKVELQTAQFAGVETLVRWNHPNDGLVGPDAFVPLAEEAGLIDELTHAVLIRALHDARGWLDAGPHGLQVAVNVSMENLRALDFPERVMQAALDAGVPLGALILEVTESRLMSDPLAALDILARLRLKRIGLSIDDFGTGHSSLAQLRDIPFSELKLDRSFVHGAPHDAAQRAILDASLDMARQLGITTVAEGVEDIDDWNFLRARGCQLAQGWFIARPMGADTLPDWLAAWDMRREQLLGYH